jgi:hypothetical protein
MTIWLLVQSLGGIPVSCTVWEEVKDGIFGRSEDGFLEEVKDGFVKK